MTWYMVYIELGKMNMPGSSVVIILCMLVSLTVSHPLSYREDPEVNYDAVSCELNKL